MKKDIQQENIEDSPKTVSKKVTSGMEIEVYNQKGKSVGKLNLPETIFDVKWNGDLVHQVVTGMQANSRTPIAHTKDRGEVRGGGKKPWRQKGTGRARHGSSRSPIWSGGGVAHGPRNEKDYSQKINKKMRVKALYTVLSEKLRKGQLLFVEEISLKDIKTKDAGAIIKDLSAISGFEKIVGGRKANTYITIPAKNEILKKSFSNIKTVKLDEVRNLNPVDLLAHKYIIISFPTESIAFLGGKMEKKKVTSK
ncbi:MAG: 50S ribosomal protein L4 [Candidatus Pacebacteria bacterium]|nr:50S ribosomal protein L4 [Candidatus Paceibacterota bacterium]